MVTVHTELCDLLEVEYPIIQAGMGMAGTVNLAAAVSNAGGLGTVSIGSMTAGRHQAREILEDSFERIIRQTNNNFAVNVPVGSSHMSTTVQQTMDSYLEGTLVSKLSDEKVADQLKVLETSGGNPERWIDDINEVKAETDLLHFHKVATADQAQEVAKLGVDGITASGHEMGGHTHTADDAVHTFVLIPAVVDVVDIPVVVSGGVRDGRSLLAALSLGAQGVYVGTRFLTTVESDFHDNYKQFIIESEEGQDILMEGEFGPIRSLDSPGLDDIDAKKNEVTGDVLSEYKNDKFIMAQQGNVEEGIVVAGQVSGYIDDLPHVDELIDSMVTQAATEYEGLEIRSS